MAATAEGEAGPACTPEYSAWRGAIIVRWIVYCHLIAVAVCLSFSLADRGLLINEGISHLVQDRFMAIVFPPALFAGLLCPAALLLAIARDLVPRRAAAIGIVVEVLLCVAHLWVLLPAVW